MGTLRSKPGVGAERDERTDHDEVDEGQNRVQGELQDVHLARLARRRPANMATPPQSICIAVEASGSRAWAASSSRTSPWPTSPPRGARWRCRSPGGAGRRAGQQDRHAEEADRDPMSVPRGTRRGTEPRQDHQHRLRAIQQRGQPRRHTGVLAHRHQAVAAEHEQDARSTPRARAHVIRSAGAPRQASSHAASAPPATTNAAPS